MMLYIVLGISILAIYGSRHMLSNLSPKANKAKVEMKKLIKELKDQADELNTPSTYSSYSKLNRKIQSMEKEMSSMPDHQGQSELYWFVVFMPYLLSLIFVGQTYEMNIYGADVYWPISPLFGYQDNKVFHFYLTSWYLLSHLVLKSLLGN